MLGLDKSKKINLKFQTSTKNKRIRDLPQDFNALKTTVEALISDERTLQPS
jgi:hypothetical protein